jgi:hypothetical protein
VDETGACENCNKICVKLKNGKFLSYPSDYNLLKNYSDLQAYSSKFYE